MLFILVILYTFKIIQSVIYFLMYVYYVHFGYLMFCNKFILLYLWLYWNISLLYKLLCSVLYNILCRCP